MAALVFFFGRNLPKCLLQWREEEDRIVPETARSAGYFQDFAVNAVSDDGPHVSAFRQRNSAYKKGGTLVAGFPTQLAEQFFDFLRVSRLLPRVPRGVHSRCASESWNNEPRVIRENKPVDLPRIVQRLPRRVFGKSGSIFLESRKRCEPRQ